MKLSKCGLQSRDFSIKLTEKTERMTFKAMPNSKNRAMQFYTTSFSGVAGSKELVLQVYFNSTTNERCCSNEQTSWTGLSICLLNRPPQRS